MRTFSITGVFLLAGSTLADDLDSGLALATTAAPETLDPTLAAFFYSIDRSSTSGAPLEKAITNADMGLLADYGCWCYFESHHGAGRGHPIDELDSFCKTLHDGYECIMFDSAQAGDTCIPWAEPYTSAFGNGFPSGLGQDEIKSICDTLNGLDTCAANACKVEGWFTQQFFTYSLAGGQIENDNRHANGFEPKDSCPISAGVRSDKACCGTYPLRSPFKTYSGARDCCVSKTFNTDMFTCCNDGRIAIVC